MKGGGISRHSISTCPAAMRSSVKDIHSCLCLTQRDLYREGGMLELNDNLFQWLGHWFLFEYLLQLVKT